VVVAAVFGAAGASSGGAWTVIFLDPALTGPAASALAKPIMLMVRSAAKVVFIESLLWA
jgi:hypothetical protein